MLYSIYVHKDEVVNDPPTGEVVPAPKPASWQEFFDLADSAVVPADFMDERADAPAQERN